MTLSKTDMEKKLSAIKQRAEKIASRAGVEHHGFLHAEAATIVGERLHAIERQFKAPAILFEGPFSKLVENNLLACKPPVSDPFRHLPFPHATNPYLDAEPDSLDLIVSVFDLARVSDLPGMLLQINFALKSDGLFLAVLPSDGTFNELRASLMQAESDNRGGAGLRVGPFPEIRQFGDLLQKTGFKLPVCDTETRMIRYSKLSGLLGDLRGAAATHIDDGQNPPLTREMLRAIEKHYSENFSDQDGRIRATFTMAFLSGWKEDASQQKPLRPGSAKHNLKDFL